MEFQNNYPIYLQIADDIKRRIVIGELHPGDKLPSNTDLAVAYTVNPNTVQRIYRQLEVEGITFTRRGVGTFLSEDPELAERLRSTILEQEVTAFLKKMQQYHFSKGCTLYSHGTAVGTSGKKGRNRNNRQKLNQKEQRDYVNI